MEFVQQEARTHIVLATVSASDQKAVYQSTTVPITNNGAVHNGRPTATTSPHLADNSAVATCSATAAADEAASASGSGTVESAGYRYANITSLPAREPLDIQFKDVSYTAKLGFFRGEWWALRDRQRFGVGYAEHVLGHSRGNRAR